MRMEKQILSHDIRIDQVVLWKNIRRPGLKKVKGRDILPANVL
jgi:hypothetical protein